MPSWHFWFNEQEISKFSLLLSNTGISSYYLLILVMIKWNQLINIWNNRKSFFQILYLRFINRDTFTIQLVHSCICTRFKVKLYLHFFPAFWSSTSLFLVFFGQKNLFVPGTLSFSVDSLQKAQRWGQSTQLLLLESVWQISYISEYFPACF